MRRPFRRLARGHHHPYRGFHRPIRRVGRLFGLMGMTAVGYAVFDKYRREQARMQSQTIPIWEDHFPDPS